MTHPRRRSTIEADTSVQIDARALPQQDDPTRSGRHERRDVGAGLPNRKRHDQKTRRSDTPPDRLSNDPRSPYYNAEVLARDVGIRFKGAEKTNVEEYCVSENWIRVAAGKALDRYGNPLTIKLTGKVEPYFKDRKEG